MIRKILVPLDGSAASESILPYVETLRRISDAAATLMTVVPRATGGREDKAWAYLKAVAPRLPNPEEVEGIVTVGAPAHDIVRQAVAGKFDLVALCSRGKGGLKRLILGSVAEEILRVCPIPVLVVHPANRWPGPTRFRQILLPLDGSERAANIVGPALSVAKMSGARIVATTVLPEPDRPAEYPQEVISKSLMDAGKKCREAGVDAEVVLRSGDPATEIIKLVDTTGVDLIAISTHGRRGLNRMVYGSVAETILRKSPAPLLVLRTAAFPRGSRVLPIRAVKPRPAAELARSGEPAGSHDQ